jgi:hypothetical protein
MTVWLACFLLSSPGEDFYDTQLFGPSFIFETLAVRSASSVHTASRHSGNLLIRLCWRVSRQQLGSKLPVSNLI